MSSPQSAGRSQAQAQRTATLDPPLSRDDAGASYAPLVLPRAAATLHAIARAASLVPVIVGVLVLIGWAQGIEVLKRGVPNLTAMNPMTAVAFICLGISLAFAELPVGSRVRIIGQAVALVAFAIGLSRLVALCDGPDLGIDQLLFPGSLPHSDFGNPNRIAPNTAINLVLLGFALATMDHAIAGRARWLGQLLSLIAAMTALLALLGYAYGLSQFYGLGAQIAMALPTAATFAIIAVGVLCARPAHGMMAVVSSDTAGGTLIRRLLPAVVIIPAGLGALRLLSDRVLHLERGFGTWLLIIAIMSVLALLVGWNALLLFRADIDRKTAERVLAYQASHDALTRLPNRRLFVDMLTRALDAAAGNGGNTSVAVLFIDLDLFKVVNDSMGHVVGDELLVAAGQRIKQALPEGAVVARISGDEFTVLMPAVQERSEVTAVADRLIQAFDASFKIGLHEVYTTVSIGVAFSQERSSPVDLIRHADIAMYAAKGRGKARYEAFDPALDVAAVQRLQLELDLRQAIAKQELCVYYQPEVELESGRLVGMEALVRWKHPQRGLVPPAQFIAVAEETGLIVPIGRWVLLEACKQVKEWQRLYRRDRSLMVSVNLSGKHLQQATLIDDVRDVLEQTQLDPGHLIIEITETVAMAGAETTIGILKKLKSLGVLLAIDDFGTGFSSLSYLKRFPVDLLKIDKSFVDGVALDSHDRAIVEAIIALGHALGLRVIAEGVETPAQLRELASLGSELGQGYFFSKPLSEDAESGMPTLLSEHRRWTPGSAA